MKLGNSFVDDRKADQARWAALAVQMQNLQQYPEWDTYKEQLGQAEARYMENLVSQPEPRTAGIVEGLRLALHLPTLLIERAKKV